jgi:hypothetical protein
VPVRPDGLEKARNISLIRSISRCICSFLGSSWCGTLANSARIRSTSIPRSPSIRAAVEPSTQSRQSSRCSMPIHSCPPRFASSSAKEKAYVLLSVKGMLNNSLGTFSAWLRSQESDPAGTARRLRREEIGSNSLNRRSLLREVNVRYQSIVRIAGMPRFARWQLRRALFPNTARTYQPCRGFSPFSALRRSVHLGCIAGSAMPRKTQHAFFLPSFLLIDKRRRQN